MPLIGVKNKKYMNILNYSWRSAPASILALDGRCNLRQEEFFGDIFVRICRAAERESDAAGSL
jgi:hypothetical protein